MMVFYLYYKIEYNIINVKKNNLLTVKPRTYETCLNTSGTFYWEQTYENNNKKKSGQDHFNKISTILT